MPRHDVRSEAVVATVFICCLFYSHKFPEKGTTPTTRASRSVPRATVSEPCGRRPVSSYRSGISSTDYRRIFVAGLPADIVRV